MKLGHLLPESLGWGLVFPLAVALALEVGWYVTRRPRGAASGYYQPVQLVTAAANGWRLRFTSAGVRVEGPAAASLPSPLEQGARAVDPGGRDALDRRRGAEHRLRISSVDLP